MRTAFLHNSLAWPDSPARIRGYQGFLVGAWLFICSGAVFPLLMLESDPALAQGGNADLRLLLLPSLLAAPVLFLLEWRAISRLLASHPALLLLGLWIWLTVFWSVDPLVSARRAASFSANTLIVCFIAVTFPPASALRIAAITVLTILALSVLAALLLPQLGFMPYSGEMRGVYTHKNGMGLCLVLAAILTALSWHHRLLPRPLLIASFATIAALAVPVGSATTIMLLMILVALHLPLKVSALPRRAAAASFLLLLLGTLTVVLPLVLARNRIFMALGRDVTLTGRTELWDFVDGMIAQRPLIGFGYNTFFAMPSVIEQVTSRIGWSAPNAHNGYREILLGLGVVGLILAMVVLLGALWRALQTVMRDPHAIASRFAFVYLCLYLFRNFSESDLVAQSDLSWVLAAFAVLLPTASAISTLPRRPAMSMRQAKADSAQGGSP